jgi:hypothetical protein
VLRLQLGYFVLADLPEHGGKVEATVVRQVDRTETADRVTLRVTGHDGFVKEWPLGARTRGRRARRR